MGDVKTALKTTATVLAVLYVLNQFAPTRRLVLSALTGE